MLKTSLQDCNFQVRMKISSEPPTKALIVWEFWRSRLKSASAIEVFERDWTFQARLIVFKIWAFRAQSCSAIVQPLRKSCASEHPEKQKRERESAWQSAVYGNYCVAFCELVRSSRDPFYSDPNTPPIKISLKNEVWRFKRCWRDFSAKGRAHAQRGPTL